MALKISYFKIGVFVIAAVAVLIGFIVMLGSGTFGSDIIRFETYIDESVHGLQVGSAVKRRGVQVGRVEEITFVTSEYDLKDKRIDYSRYVMVVIAANKEDFGSYRDEQSFYSMLDDLIDKGLRMRLTTQALTGIAYLEVDYFDPERYPPLEPSWKPKHKYVPSAPSLLGSFAHSIEEVFQKLDDVPFVEITQNLNGLLISLNETIQETRVTDISNKIIVLLDEVSETNEVLMATLLKTQETIEDANIKVLSEDARGLIANIDESVAQMTNTINAEVLELSRGFKDTNTLIQNILKPASLEQTTIPELAASIDSLVAEIQTVVRENRNEMESLTNKLNYISSDLMNFSQSLKQDPGSVFFSQPPAPSEVVK